MSTDNGLPKCTGGYFPSPMSDQYKEYHAALEELWNATKSTDWQVGYNPEFTKACERLRELDRKRAE